MENEKKKELQRHAGGRGITDYIPEYDEQAYNYWRTASLCLVQLTKPLPNFLGYLLLL